MADKPSGTQRWRELLFVHWSFPIEEVRALVPAPLEIDTYDGKAWIGLVPFVMKDIRSSWMPKGAGLNFLETNVRTYVRYKDEPGVFFFSLDASSWLAVKVARSVWSLPYFHAGMSTTRTESRIEYASVRKSETAEMLRVTYELGEHLGPSREGTFEHFLLERYILFSFARRGQLMRGRVQHVPYPAQKAGVLSLEQSLVPTTRPFEAVHYAEGVDVEVFGPWPVQ